LLECFYSRRKALSESVRGREKGGELPQEVATTQDRQDRHVLFFFVEDEVEEEVREEEEEARETEAADT